MRPSQTWGENKTSRSQRTSCCWPAPRPAGYSTPMFGTVSVRISRQIRNIYLAGEHRSDLAEASIRHCFPTAPIARGSNRRPSSTATKLHAADQATRKTSSLRFPHSTPFPQGLSCSFRAANASLPALWRGQQKTCDSRHPISWAPRGIRRFLADFRGCPAAAFPVCLLMRTETVPNMGVESPAGRGAGQQQDVRCDLLVLFSPHVWDGLMRTRRAFRQFWPTWRRGMSYSRAESSRFSHAVSAPSADSNCGK